MGFFGTNYLHFRTQIWWINKFISRLLFFSWPLFNTHNWRTRVVVIAPSLLILFLRLMEINSWNKQLEKPVLWGIRTMQHELNLQLCPSIRPSVGPCWPCATCCFELLRHLNRVSWKSEQFHIIILSELRWLSVRNNLPAARHGVTFLWFFFYYYLFII